MDGLVVTWDVKVYFDKATICALHKPSLQSAVKTIADVALATQKLNKQSLSNCSPKRVEVYQTVSNEDGGTAKIRADYKDDYVHGLVKSLLVDIIA